MCFSILAAIIGVKVRETKAEKMIVTARVTANSRNRRPTISAMNSSGISTAISETVSETMVNPISSEPLSAACMGESPISRYREMFSIITIASSTTKPVEMVSALSDRLSRLYPSMYITPNVPTSESGTAMPGMIVAERLRRNRKMTITTSAMVSINSNSTSRTDARMVVVRSVMTRSFTPSGSDAWICGSRAVTVSTTPMMLVPGCR